MTDNEARTIIKQKKKEFGDRLTILGHHYQTDGVIAYADYVGDSLELARKASEVKRAQHIVFCGVYFMAESATILAPGKSVYIPDASAGCPLADMARADDVNKAWQFISSVTSSVVPVTYVNSSAEIKAFCGRHEGIVCTSGNALKVMEWAFGRKDKVFFLPDMNLGRNTARKMGFREDEIAIWDKDAGGLDRSAIEKATVIVWKGWCPVHWPQFTVDDVKAVKEQYPGVRVIVHPEADPKTVIAADRSGSTAKILKFIKEMHSGETVAVGTEANLVKRAARKSKDVTIVPLREVYCDDMAKITLPKLADTLLHLGDDTYRVTVPDGIAADARTALTNMLRI